MPGKTPKYSFKLLLLGQPEVGKTSLIRRYVDDFFAEGYQITLGVDFLSKTIKIPDKKGKASEVTFQIWDVAGQSGFTNFRHLYLKKAHGVFLVFDMNRPETFDKLTNWKKDVNENSPGAVIYVVGNKEDLNSTPPKDPKEILKIYQASKFFTTSAKTGSRVQEAFETIAKEIFEKMT